MAQGTITSEEKQAVITGVDDPVAQVRNLRSWEYGPFINWGSGLGDRSDYKFLSAGFELSKILTPVVHARFLSGQFQYGGNIMPLWQAYTPPPHTVEIHLCEFIGAAVFLPLGVRWRNVLRSQPDTGDLSLEFLDKITKVSAVDSGGRRIDLHDSQVSAQLHERCSAGNRWGTSVWNFSPQGGGGIHYFFRDKRSIDLNVNGVHISSASLGDRNPGVNASVQVQVGYTFWK